MYHMKIKNNHFISVSECTDGNFFVFFYILMDEFKGWDTSWNSVIILRHGLMIKIVKIVVEKSIYVVNHSNGIMLREEVIYISGF